jgi:S1-C subfamily serine protease
VISEDGRLVTNFHVVKGAERVVATFASGAKSEVAGVWAADPKLDLAVLQLGPGPFSRIALSDSDAKQGDEVTVIGSPRGLEGSVSTGIVSAIRREGALAMGGDEDRHVTGAESWGLQITAPISPGSSGSPVLDATGRVLGVAVGQIEGGQALNFAVPVSKLRDLVRGIGPTSQLKPLDLLHEGTLSVRANLLISAAGFAAVALLWWLGSYISSRRERSARTVTH